MTGLELSYLVTTTNRNFTIHALAEFSNGKEYAFYSRPIFISKADVWHALKVIQSIPGMARPVTETEVNNFLENKLNIQLATVDQKGYPEIQPLWFLYERDSSKIYVGTQKRTKKIQNIQRNPDKVYFSIDDEKYPYRGVKGRAIARVSEDIQQNLPIVTRINMKYLGTLEHPLAKMIIENTKNGTEVVIELVPKFFSAWDFSKAS